MKKSLSLLLAIAMVFSMFASVAMAAEAQKDAGEFLKEIGVISGNADGDLMADKQWKRQDVVIILSTLLGKQAEAKATAKSHPFTDVNDSFYDGFISWAYENKLVVGKSATTFGWNDMIKYHEFAAIMIRALGLDVEYADVPAAAEKLGFALPEGASWEDKGTRGEYFNVIVVTLNTEVEAGVKLGTKLGLKGFEVKEQGIASATVVGAKKVEVKFNQAIADTSKVTVSLKKAAVTTNIKEVTYSTDKKTATLETSVKLTKGDYTVSVSGLGDTALTKDFTADDEKVTKVEFTSLNAVLDRDDAQIVTANFIVKNNYDEDVTADGGLTFSAGKGAPVPNYADGTLELTAPGATTYTRDEKINVSALHTASTTFASAVLVVVDPAKVADIAITGVYNQDGDSAEAGMDSQDFYLVVEAKDQYGNAMTDADDVNDDVVITNANSTIFPVFNQAATRFGTVDDRFTYQLPVGTLAAGTAKVTLVSKSTGHLSTFDVVVAEASKVDVLTMSQPAAPVAGEDIEIPFTAIDQFGKEVTSLSTLTGTTSLSTSPTTPAGTVRFVRDYVKGVNKLMFDSDGMTGTVVITAVANGKVTMLTINLKDAPVATVIAGVKDFTKVYAIDGTATLETGNIIVHDQYGREMTPDYGATAGKYQVIVESSAPGKVALSGDTAIGQVGSTSARGLQDDTDAITFTGIAKGNSTITLKLATVDVGAAAVTQDNKTAYTFTTKAVEKADIVSYEVGDIGKIHAKNAATHTVDIDVKGVLADGSKVAIPASYYDANLVAANEDNQPHFGLAGLTIHVLASVAGPVALDVDDNGEAKATLVVTFIAPGSPLVTKEVVASTKAPALTSIYLDGNSANLSVVDAGTFTLSVADPDDIDTTPELRSEIIDILKAKDQYGKGYTLASGDFIAGVTVNSVTDGRALNALRQGDVVTATVITKGSKAVTVKIIVE